MTYLAESNPWLPEADNLRNRALFLDLSTAVRDVLLEAVAAVAQCPCPEWLLSLINYCAANGVFAPMSLRRSFDKLQLEVNTWVDHAKTDSLKLDANAASFLPQGL